MSRVCLVNGSPSGDKATSLVFAMALVEALGEEVETELVSLDLGRRRPTRQSTLDALSSAEVLVFSLPLYAYGLPAAMIKLLEDFAAMESPKEPARVYAIVNSGYGDPAVNTEALRILRHFCQRCGLRWRFGVMVGGGLLVAMMKEVPVARWRLDRALAALAEDIRADGAEPRDDLSIRPVIPLTVMNYLKDSDWSKRFMDRREAKAKR